MVSDGIKTIQGLLRPLNNPKAENFYINHLALLKDRERLLLLVIINFLYAMKIVNQMAT